MKVTFLNKLNEEEAAIFYSSKVYHASLKESHYSELIISYNHQYFPDEYLNTSLVLWDEESPTLYIPSFSTHKTYSFFGSPIEIFEDNTLSNSIAEAYKLLLKYLTEFLKREEYSHLLFKNNSYFLNFFYNKIEHFNNSFIGVINLQCEIDFIKSSFRKSYKSLINWGERELKIQIINSENFTDDHINEFRKFHINVAGKETRNQQTWDIQGELIKQNQAFIIRAEYQEKLVAISFYQHGISSVLYGVGVYDRELMAQNLPLAHSSLFYAIKEAKNRELKELIMGDINHNNENQKEAQIAKFKKGFVNQCLNIPHYSVKLN